MINILSPHSRLVEKILWSQSRDLTPLEKQSTDYKSLC